MVGWRVVLVLALLLPGTDCRALSKQDLAHAKQAHAHHKVITQLASGFRDLEIELSPVKAGLTIIGALCGAAMGVVTGATTMGSSEAEPEAQDGGRHLVAGLLAGAMVGWTFDHDKCGKAEWTTEERHELMDSGMQKGAALGVVAGAMGIVVSGSSDEDGPSASLSGSSGSSGGDDAKKGDEAAAEEKPAVMASLDIPSLHNAVAGAVAGAMVAYILPEMCSIAGIVGGAAVDAANQGDRLYKSTDFGGLLQSAKESGELLAKKATDSAMQSVGLPAIKALATKALRDAKIEDELLTKLVNDLTKEDLPLLKKVVSSETLSADEKAALVKKLGTTDAKLDASFKKLQESDAAKKLREGIKLDDFKLSAVKLDGITSLGSKLLGRGAKAPEWDVAKVAAFQAASVTILAEAKLEDPTLRVFMSGMTAADVPLTLEVLEGKTLEDSRLKPVAERLSVSLEDLKTAFGKLKDSPGRTKLKEKFDEITAQSVSLEEEGEENEGGQGDDGDGNDS